MAKKKQEKNENQVLIDQLNTVVGCKSEDLIMQADEYISIDSVISTGCKELDTLITPQFMEKHGKGGVPRGYVCEFFGPHGGGKSSLGHRLAADVTSNGERVLWIDIESSYHSEWAQNFGVVTKNVLRVDSWLTGEAYFKMIIDASQSGKFALIVVDSVTGLRPAKIMNQELDKEARVGASAMLMSRGLPDVVRASRLGNCTVVFVNQIRQKIGMFYSGETTPHGEALRFYSSLRLRVSSVYAKKGKREIMSNGEGIGLRSNVQIVKNRFGPPYKECVVPIYYIGKKPDALEQLIDLAMSTKVIKTKRNKSENEGEEDEQTFSLFGEHYEDFDSLKAALIDDTEIVDKIVEAIKEKNIDIPVDIVDHIKSVKESEEKMETGSDDDTTEQTKTE